MAGYPIYPPFFTPPTGMPIPVHPPHLHPPSQAPVLPPLAPTYYNPPLLMPRIHPPPHMPPSQPSFYPPTPTPPAQSGVVIRQSQMLLSSTTAQTTMMRVPEPSTANTAACSCPSSVVRPPLSNNGVTFQPSNSSLESYVTGPPIMSTEDASAVDDTEKLYWKFKTLIFENGPLECSNQKLLCMFIKLSPEERRLVMGAGSIQQFLTESPYFIVENNVVREKTEDEIKLAEAPKPVTLDKSANFEERCSSYAISFENPREETATLKEKKSYMGELNKTATNGDAHHDTTPIDKSVSATPNIISEVLREMRDIEAKELKNVIASDKSPKQTVAPSPPKENGDDEADGCSTPERPSSNTPMGVNSPAFIPRFSFASTISTTSTVTTVQAPMTSLYTWTSTSVTNSLSQAAPRPVVGRADLVDPPVPQPERKTWLPASTSTSTSVTPSQSDLSQYRFMFRQTRGVTPRSLATERKFTLLSHGMVQTDAPQTADQACNTRRVKTACKGTASDVIDTREVCVGTTISMEDQIVMAPLTKTKDASTNTSPAKTSSVKVQTSVVGKSVQRNRSTSTCDEILQSWFESQKKMVDNTTQTVRVKKARRSSDVTSGSPSAVTAEQNSGAKSPNPPRLPPGLGNLGNEIYVSPPVTPPSLPLPNFGLSPGDMTRMMGQPPATPPSLPLPNFGFSPGDMAQMMGQNQQVMYQHQQMALQSPLLQHMMIALLQSMPNLASDPVTLQSIAVNHLITLQNPGMTSPSPGMTPQIPGMAPPSPGMTSPSPGMTPQIPGMAPPSPGMTSPSPGMTPQNLGMTSQNLGMTPPSPGMTPQNPGKTPQNPGKGLQKPGMGLMPPASLTTPACSVPTSPGEHVDVKAAVSASYNLLAENVTPPPNLPHPQSGLTGSQIPGDLTTGVTTPVSSAPTSPGIPVQVPVSASSRLAEHVTSPSKRTLPLGQTKITGSRLSSYTPFSAIELLAPLIAPAPSSPVSQNQTCPASGASQKREVPVTSMDTAAPSMSGCKSPSADVSKTKISKKATKQKPKQPVSESKATAANKHQLGDVGEITKKSKIASEGFGSSIISSAWKSKKWRSKQRSPTSEKTKETASVHEFKTDLHVDSFKFGKDPSRSEKLTDDKSVDKNDNVKVVKSNKSERSSDNSRPGSGMSGSYMTASSETESTVAGGPSRNNKICGVNEGDGSVPAPATELRKPCRQEPTNPRLGSASDEEWSTDNFGSYPARVTSPPARVTSPPARVTSPPAQMTSPPARVTSPPARMTSPLARVTSPPAQILGSNSSDVFAPTWQTKCQAGQSSTAPNKQGHILDMFGDIPCRNPTPSLKPKTDSSSIILDGHRERKHPTLSSTNTVFTNDLRKTRSTPLDQSESSFPTLARPIRRSVTPEPKPRAPPSSTKSAPKLSFSDIANPLKKSQQGVPAGSGHVGSMTRLGKSPMPRTEQNSGVDDSKTKKKAENERGDAERGGNESDGWQEAGKRRRKKSEVVPSTKVVSKIADSQTCSKMTAYDRLLEKLIVIYPGKTRGDLLALIEHVRKAFGGSLKGTSLGAIIKHAVTLSPVGAVIKKKTEDKSQSAVNQHIHKSQICSFWEEGNCPRTAAECSYAHGQQELNKVPKTRICQNIIQKGVCSHGNTCIFAHSNAELQKTQAEEQLEALTSRKRPVGMTKRSDNTLVGHGHSSSGSAPQSHEPAMGAKRSTTPLAEIIVSNSNKDESKNCPICMYTISPQSSFETECNHVFHKMCIYDWIDRERTCPLCRAHVLLPDQFPKLGMK